MDAHLTEPAGRSVRFAREEARTLGDAEVGTEHLLLGLLREENGVAARAMLAAGLSPGRVRGLLEGRSEPRPGAEDGGRRDVPELSNVAKGAIRRARPVAWHSGAAKAGTAHLLLVLLGDPDGPACRMVADAGVRPAELEREVRRMVDEGHNDGITAWELREEAQRLRQAADALNEAYGGSLWRLMLPGVVSSLTLGAAVGAGVYAAIRLARRK